jgi:hypothetical protein
MSNHIPDDLINAAFFFVDIVGLSNPSISTETQRTKIMVLNELINSCEDFRSTPKESLFVLPTGDGMLLGFKDGLEQPIKLALELHEKLNEYNQRVPHTEKISTRIGLNVGYVFIIKDFFGNVNLWGPGAILARRVMDLGNENHILLTSNMADDLIELSDEYEKILHPIYDFKIKHNEEILVYNAFGNNFGNQNVPKKSKNHVPLNIEKNAKCEKIIFNISINDLRRNLIKHERIYYFVNDSAEPIYNINIGITTRAQKEIHDLNVKIFDEIEELKVSRISFLSPYIKELTVKLRKPVFRGDSGRMIKVHYDVEEPFRYFENFFLTDSNRFELNFSFPTNFTSIAPRLYYVDLKNDKEIPIDGSKNVIKGITTIIQWQKNDGVKLKDAIRLEW